MDVIYVLIPIVLLFGFLVVIAFIWMAKKGFFEDLDGQGSRILMDDDDFPDAPKHPSTASEVSNEKTSQVSSSK
ncbi:cytochrome oxidase maturation protein, cbb3-type [Thiosulfatimonas sediminis]|uniref:Cytochrome oxidase maturation protein, cbb3-type n=1 Tax=Thiosulfatimonas sediminis TaxID=2675054 RepID=A0A6F8PS29_9GAMM|nr:cbb3-type cytochrome oxidase assembly protein CcoS [Thiosulfatimonas sediminis]BBP44828.1 cytochrome oxidase maturation protein, cbb3-type [Thiosulfatimonas sediminis]